MGRGGSFRNDFLEAKVAMVVVGRRGKQADEVTAFTTRGRVQRTPASFYGSISVYSRSTRARLPDERKNVGRCVGSVRSRFIDLRFENSHVVRSFLLSSLYYFKFISYIRYPSYPLPCCLDKF